MWKNRLLYILFLAGAVVFYFDHIGWISEYLLVLTMCLPFVSLLCSLPIVYRRRILSAAGKSCKRNERRNVVFSLEKKGRSCSPLCRITVELQDRLAGVTVRDRVFLDRRSRCTFFVPTEHCGIYEFRLVKAYAYDFLGLFRFRVETPQACSVMVEPIAKGPEKQPDFSGFQPTVFKPKVGGGFSELYELREYRSGDQLRAVHWKLSSKTDSLMIREAQEPEAKRALVYLELTPERAELDSVLDELRWVSERLLELEIPHYVRYFAGNGPKEALVTDENELWRIMRDIMSRPVQSGIAEANSKSGSCADWYYRITPRGKGENSEEK